MANVTAEANVTLRPRAGDGHALPDATVNAPFVDEDDPTPTSNTREVTLCIMTQDPFPADD